MQNNLEAEIGRRTFFLRLNKFSDWVRALISVYQQLVEGRPNPRSYHTQVCHCNERIHQIVMYSSAFSSADDMDYTGATTPA